MSNFYSKRFLSALMGALSVLSSPVASARDDKLGKGNLKGRGGASARRDKNNGKLGGLESNRKVKSVNDLEKVLKETGGKVVGVSPDGKGGFVAFVKTPTGKVVTVAIVSVPLAVIIYCLVCFGRKNKEGIGRPNISIEESEKIIEPDKSIAEKGSGRDIGSEKIIKDESWGNRANLIGDDSGKAVKGVGGGVLLERKSIENPDIASVNSLEQLFGNVRRYNLFVEKLFGVFFNDKKGMRDKFDSCKGNLDEFLRVVFEESSFKGSYWEVGTEECSAVFGWENGELEIVAFDSASDVSFIVAFLEVIFNYLSEKYFIGVSKDGQASWGDKISALLFGFWCSVGYNLDIEEDAGEVKKTLCAKDSKRLGEVFVVISRYVRDRLEAAGKDYNGQELKQVGDLLST